MIFSGETRLESECTAGEGTFFRFRYERCVPQGLDMAANQHLYCMASWQDGVFTFTVLRHTTTERAWCFRYPTLGGYEFRGQLFRDVHCDRLADDYISLTIQRDRSPSMTSLCTDDYEACSHWTSPCSHTGSLTQVGPRARLLTLWVVCIWFLANCRLLVADYLTKSKNSSESENNSGYRKAGNDIILI